MYENAHAILMGINVYSDRRLPTLSFAEKDAEDLGDVLSDAVIGNFPAGNVVTVLGKELTTRAGERILYTHAVKNRKPGDVVLVYFSGHGFKVGTHQKAYLGTYDVQLDHLTENTNAGLRLDYIHEEIFMRSQAQYILLILDCCHSGAFVPEALRGSAFIEEGSVLGLDIFSRVGAFGRVALVACRHDALSRESANLKNGVFTHYLLAGLRGAAAEPETGEVTLDSLLSYVRNNAPSEPTLQARTRHVLPEALDAQLPQRAFEVAGLAQQRFGAFGERLHGLAHGRVILRRHARSNQDGRHPAGEARP